MWNSGNRRNGGKRFWCKAEAEFDLVRHERCRIVGGIFRAEETRGRRLH